MTVECMDIFHENWPAYVTLKDLYEKGFGKMIMKGSYPSLKFQHFLRRYLGSRTRRRT